MTSAPLAWARMRWRRSRFAASYSGAFTLSTVGDAYGAIEASDAAGKIVVDIG